MIVAQFGNFETKLQKRSFIWWQVLFFFSEVYVARHFELLSLTGDVIFKRNLAEVPSFGRKFSFINLAQFFSVELEEMENVKLFPVAIFVKLEKRIVHPQKKQPKQHHFSLVNLFHETKTLTICLEDLHVMNLKESNETRKKYCFFFSGFSSQSQHFCCFLFFLVSVCSSHLLNPNKMPFFHFERKVKALLR